MSRNGFVCTCKITRNKGVYYQNENTYFHGTQKMMKCVKAGMKSKTKPT